MDDLAWLATRTTALALDPGTPADGVRAFLSAAGDAGCHSAAVYPTHLPLVPEGLRAAAVVGYPSGRHHTLIKASEARLAVELGADEVWLALDPTVGDANTLLAEVVAVRQAVPAPVSLAVLSPSKEAARAAYAAGADAAVVDTPGGDARDVVKVATVDEAVAALEAGASRVATAQARWS